MWSCGSRRSLWKSMGSCPHPWRAFSAVKSSWAVTGVLTCNWHRVWSSSMWRVRGANMCLVIHRCRCWARRDFWKSKISCKGRISVVPVVCSWWWARNCAWVHKTWSGAAICPRRQSMDLGGIVQQKSKGTVQSNMPSSGCMWRGAPCWEERSPKPLAPPVSNLCGVKALRHPHGQSLVMFPHEWRTVAAWWCGPMIRWSSPYLESVYTAISLWVQASCASSCSDQMQSRGIRLPKVKKRSVCGQLSRFKAGNWSVKRWHQKRFLEIGHCCFKSKINLEHCIRIAEALQLMSAWTSWKLATFATHSSSTASAWSNQAAFKVCSRTDPRSSLRPWRSPCCEYGWQGNPHVTWSKPGGRWAWSSQTECRSSTLPWTIGDVKLDSRAWHANSLRSRNAHVFMPMACEPMVNPPIPLHTSMIWNVSFDWFSSWRKHLVSLVNVQLACGPPSTTSKW